MWPAPPPTIAPLMQPLAWAGAAAPTIRARPAAADRMRVFTQFAPGVIGVERQGAGSTIPVRVRLPSIPGDAYAPIGVRQDPSRAASMARSAVAAMRDAGSSI